jgi:hypothetical protein
MSVIAKSGATASPIVVNRVIAPLNTNSVTYNTRPSFVATPSQINVTTSDIYTTVQIDITTLVNGWLNGTYTNYGLALTNPDGTTVVQFGTNHIIYEPHFPKLLVNYPVGPESSAINFCYDQLAHLIEQLIVLYPTNAITVYTTGAFPYYVTGTPYQLYSSPEGTYGGIFVVDSGGGQYGAIPLDAIVAIDLGTGGVYNPAITYLTPPTFPQGFDTNIVTAIHDYLPVPTSAEIDMGANLYSLGPVYKDEYGIIVQADALGNLPTFIPVMKITGIYPAITTALSSMLKNDQQDGGPRIKVKKPQI